MEHVRPSHHPNVNQTSPIRACVRKLSNDQLVQAQSSSKVARELTGYDGSGYAACMFLMHQLMLERRIRNEMAASLFEPLYRQVTETLDDGTRTELYIQQLSSAVRSDNDDDDMIYGDDPNDLHGDWYVSCRRHRWPWSGILPLAFTSESLALAAKHALERANLCTEAALDQRIKVQRDWQSVKTIMRAGRCG